MQSFLSNHHAFMLALHSGVLVCVCFSLCVGAAVQDKVCRRSHSIPPAGLIDESRIRT